jgi:hypothetical protein
LLEELGEGGDGYADDTWRGSDVLTFTNGAKSFQQLGSRYVVLLQEERESTDN